MKTLKEILEVSLLDIEGQLNIKLNDFSLLFRAKSKEEYEELLENIISNYKKINPVKVSNIGSDINLKKNVLYMIVVEKDKKFNISSFIYIGIYGKSKNIGMHWSSKENKVIASIYNNPISYLSNSYDWYELPKTHIKDFEEFKDKIKNKT